jgi:LemA protein
MSNILIALLAAVFLLLVFIIGVFNRLVILRARSNEAWAQTDVQLKLRGDLVPNLVETVKGYAAHEKSTLENVIKARAMVSEAASLEGGQEKTIEANNALTGALKSLFAVTEGYPELKANDNFIKLQTELSGIEEKIAYARQFYNECVMKYNQYQQEIPGAFFASAFGHKQALFFQVQEAERSAPQVKF